ncbi:hypothetical protein Daura_09390 [Dactylosporangium aurantiacum]|uniref:DUF11 domain-containing protein n=1 Tax=Dactylosporangium aurantiacum TaxID=35754 RepID=A0A9Q9IM53_9ACTN|nr:hypothetical protein [Dactylosporangium aurantiacum]MDG6109505.1 hypothetical protein [Dactylosporangium aurantiacum]UWZ56362.1 hypothetical protein Daura_09390 [Dactylosporangium aurantiacum]
MTTRVAGRSARHDAAHRRVAAAAALAVAVGAGVFGALAAARPAHAATAEADIEAKVGDGSVQGKAGEKTSVGFQVENHGKIDVAVVVTIRVPSNAQIESAGSCAVASNRTVASCQANLKAGASANGSIQLVLRSGGEGEGSVVARLAANQRVTDPKPGNNDAKFKLRVTGASATASPSKSTRASRSASAEPTGTSDEVIAPPEAGNGAIPREDPTTKPVSDSGGLGFGFWIGVIAIVAALGLVGSLFYFRRKDRLEPDTGVFQRPNIGQDNPTSVITPGVYGSPAAPSYQGGPGGSNVYGAPPAPPAGFPPAASPGFPPAAPPPPGMPPAPGANDQTVLMRRPDDL